MTFSRHSDYGVAEITWENGQPAMHGAGRTNETLESIVHQAATSYNQSQNQETDIQDSQILPRTQHIRSNVASSCGKRVDNAGPSYLKKRPRSAAIDRDYCVRNLGLQKENISNGEDNDTTMMTWAIYFCAKENQEEEFRDEGETIRSRSSRVSRAAAIHNQSERGRRERINQKMKALQKLVPNANKIDKASMLDEVIDYLKKLQIQVQIMKNMSISSPQMMIPVPLQLQQHHHHLQMSMLAQMRMRSGFQMAMPTPAQHPFIVPQTMTSPWLQTIHSHPSTNTTDPFSDTHSAFLAQVCQEPQERHMNTMDAFYRQQVNQGKSMGMSSSHPANIRGE